MNDLLSIVDTLCKTPRVGWLQRGVEDAESICSHTLLTTLLAGEIAARLRLVGEEIDVAEALAAAVVHDLAESILGHPGREVRDRVKWEEVEDEVFKREFPHLLEFFRWYRFETNLVGRVVAFADKLATLIRACRYTQRGYPAGDLAKSMYQKLSSYGEFLPFLEEYVAVYCRGVSLV
ncbi:MAG: HD family hydrolase [Pyrobaculum sp.]